MKTKLRKDRTLVQNEHVLAVISAELEGSLVTPAEPGSSAAKVYAHILSSKALAAEVATVIQNIKTFLNPPVKTKRLIDDEEEESEEDIDIPPRPRKASKAESSIKKVSIPLNEDAGSEPSNASTSGDGLEASLEVVDEDDVDIDDGGWESGSVNGGADSDEDTEDGDLSDENVERPSHKASVQSSRASKSKPITSSANSTFLPSLSVGFTRGDSDASDIEEVDVDAADGGARKNRRGQRARRA